MWSQVPVSAQVLSGVMCSVYVCVRALCREVTKARDKATGKLVALKKIRMENEKDGVRENGQGNGCATRGWSGTYCHVIDYLCLSLSDPMNVITATAIVWLHCVPGLCPVVPYDSFEGDPNFETFEA